MIAPPSLRSGDTIAIVPTARAITQAELTDGMALAESWGLKVKLGNCIGRKHFQQAGTDEERAADLQRAIDDPAVRAIWCARGGYGTVRLLDRIDLDRLKKDPKWIIGFSDVTALHNALHRTGIRSLHAQMPFNIAGKSEASKEGLRKILFGEPAPIHVQKHGSMHHDLDRNGEAEGILVGGNLSVLHSLRGTFFDLDPKGKILFLEDLDELLYHVDRMVQNLKLGGWFRDLTGLIVGGMSDMRNKNEADPFGRSAEEIISNAIGAVNYPVCFGFPAGHIDDNKPLVLGAPMRLSVTDREIRFEPAGQFFSKRL